MMMKFLVYAIRKQPILWVLRLSSIVNESDHILAECTLDLILSFLLSTDERRW